ncbi:hypothetical protein ABPG72_019676 [Tetrahymena utriculariae]
MDINGQRFNLAAMGNSQESQQHNNNNQESIVEEDKFQLQQFREEHSVEIRQNKRKQILKKNRVLPVDHQEYSSGYNQVLGDFPDLNAIQGQTIEEFQAFVNLYIPIKLEDASESQRKNNVQVLVSAITSNCSPQFFIFATQELNNYFQDETASFNIFIQDIYHFIDIILASSFIKKVKIILSDWRTALGLGTVQNNSYFAPILRIDKNLPRKYLIGCLNILCGISRGGDNHCSIFEANDLLQTLFDIFNASKTQRDIIEIMLFTIGNIAATRNQWRIFFMQHDFHNIIFNYLKYAPKNQENLLLHRRICWCLSNFTRDYVSLQQNNGSSQILANGQVVTEIIDNSQFDFAHIKNLADTFIEYQDQEIRTDISWTFQQLVLIFFPKLNGNIIMPVIEGCKINNNLSQQQNLYYKQLVTEKIGFLIQNGICEFINEAYKSTDMTIIVPILRIINRIMAGSGPVLELFFSKCNDTIVQYTAKHLQNQVQLIRKETIKTLHYMFACELDGFKEMWFNKFMQIVMTRFNTEQLSVKEEIYKLLNTIIDSVNPIHFEYLTLNGANRFCIFRVMRNSLGSYETKPEAIITILSILLKVLSYYKLGNSTLQNQKVKRIIQILDQNNLPQCIEKLQEHSQQGIYEYAVQFIELYNKIQENIVDEEHKETNSQPIKQDYIRQGKFDNQSFEKIHEEQKI